MPLIGRIIEKRYKGFLIKSAVAIFLACISSMAVIGQPVGSIPYKSQEMSETGGVPVLMEHLPDWENVKKRAAFAKSVGELKASLGDRPILDLVDFTAGTEAVTAQYDAGKLLIIEYTNPQASVDADNKFTGLIADTGDQTTAYRRIGNYNVLVLDTPDQTAATALIDQVKYEKQIQWLGKNPFRISAERAFVMTTADIFFSTLMVIVGGIVLSIFTGLIVGFLFFYFRDGKRSKMTTYTDAGGMIRLNLDGFTPDIIPSQLLKD